MRSLGSVLVLLGLTTAATLSAQAQGRVIKRDLQEWLDAQGTQTTIPRRGYAPNTPRIFGLGNNPDINGDGVLDGPRYMVWWDYAGVLARPGSTGYIDADHNLGPSSITGSVTERPLGDGSSEITVALDVKGALLWVSYAPPFPSTGPVTVFGHTEVAVAAGATQAYADGQYTVKFKHPTGAPFIDLITSNLAGNWHESFLVLHGDGFFTEHFSSDVEEGTPGLLRWGKPYITVPANPKAKNGAASAFPNDEFHLFPVGK